MANEYLTDDDLFEKDLDELNSKVAEIVSKAVEAAKKEASAVPQGSSSGESGKTGESGDGQKPVPEELTREQLDSFDPASLDYAIFKHEDADVKETAKLMFEKAVAKLKEGSSRKDVEAVAGEVSRKLSRMLAASGGDAGADDDPYKGGPVPAGTSGASAAHLSEKAPQTISEAEDMSMKIASGWKAR